MDARSAEQRLSAIEARLARLEARLGLPVEDAARVREVEPELEEIPVPPPLPTQRPAAWRPPQPARVTSQVAEQEDAEAALASLSSPPMPVRPLPRPVSGPVPPPRPRATGTFETQVGLKWAGWAGAIIVVIGLAL